MESLAHQGCIYFKKYWKNSILQFLILVSYFNTYILKYNLFLWSKAEFSASLLQSSVSHDPSEIILKCWIIISVADLICWFTVKLLCCLIFLEPVLLFSLINKKLKRIAFIQIDIFSNNISLYYQFYPCNTSLLNKVSLTFFKLF